MTIEEQLERYLDTNTFSDMDSIIHGLLALIKQQNEALAEAPYRTVPMEQALRQAEGVMRVITSHNISGQPHCEQESDAPSPA